MKSHKDYIERRREHIHDCCLEIVEQLLDTFDNDKLDLEQGNDLMLAVIPYWTIAEQTKNKEE